MLLTFTSGDWTGTGEQTADMCRGLSAVIERERPQSRTADYCGRGGSSGQDANIAELRCVIV